MSSILVNSKYFKPIFYLLQWTWGIIQNILGLLIYLYLKYTGLPEMRYRYNAAYVTRWRLKSSMSLGMFIFMGNEDIRTLVHEFGHSIQSCILGPFYLIVIGIPSWLWANIPILAKWRATGKVRYSAFYPEKWANYLGMKFTGQKPIRF